MMFDVMVRKFEKVNGKESYVVSRVHHLELSKFVRKSQDEGDYVFAVIPLFKKNNTDDNGEVKQ
jgi:hypothetical protein